MNEKRRNGWFRAGQAAALVVMALLGMLDVSAGLFDGPLPALTGPVQVVLALATAAVWLPAYRQNSQVLPALAIGLGLWSLGVTLLVGLPNSAGRGSWGLAESLGMGFVMMSVARRGAAAPSVFAAAVCGLAVAAQPLRSGVDSEMLAFGMLQALLGAGALAIGVYQRVVVGTRERELTAVRAEQRAEFARDLHDFIAHHVTGIVVQAQGARFIAETDPKRAVTALEQIERAGGETMAAMRRMVGVLRGQGTDAPLAPLSGVADVKRLIDDFTAAMPNGPQVRLHVDAVRDDLPVDISSSAYRVVMEALTNVRQHAAGAEAVDVYLRQTPDWLLVRVANDAGAAQRAAPVARERGGFGLVGLEERVTAIGGRLQVGPGIAGGWVVDAALPLREELR